MTPREYLDQVIRPNLDELAAEPGSIRRALNAIHAVDALAARIYVAARGEAAIGDKDDTHYRERLANGNSDFRLIRDLAKAVKHAELTRTPKKGLPLLVRQASNVEVKALGFDTGYWDELKLDMQPEPVVDLGDGTYRIIGAVLVRALAILETEMDTRGL